MNRVNEFLESLNISDKEKVIVACSGGPDSMFLLDFLYQKGINIICAHVNHKVRTESEEEYQFVLNYCKEKNIPFEGIELTGYESGNFEQYARHFRYSFFERLIKKYNSKYLFTAHHGDDLMETILMRLSRGSSLKGYSGFLKITEKDNYRIIRPLIYLTKEEIERYNIDNGIPFVKDYTNDLDDYTRNRYRHHLLPFLKKENINVHDQFIKFSEELNDAYSFIEDLARKELKLIYKDDVLDIDKFNNLNDYLKRVIIEKILDSKYPNNLYLVNKNHINELLKIIKSEKKNVQIRLPDSILVIKEYNKLKFSNDSIRTLCYSYILRDELDLPNGIIKIVKDSTQTDNYVIRLNSKDIKLPLHIRSRQNGDKIYVKNMNGTKKVNDIFIDLKITKENREVWPILCDDSGEILWIPGLKKSKKDIPIDKCYDIIVKYEKKEK